MPVDISIDSFPANDFAPLGGIIYSIGSDVLDLNEENNQEYFFSGSIKLNSQSLLLNNGNELPLQVGMSLKANIKLRKVSYLKLLLGSFRDKAESIKIYIKHQFNSKNLYFSNICLNNGQISYC